MENEGRDTVAHRKAIYDLLQPELKELFEVVSRMKSKVGVEGSWESSHAVSAVIGSIFRGFPNIACGIFGWCEIDSEGKGVTHTSSYAHRFFSDGNRDLTLAVEMKAIIRMLATEEYEIVETVQRNRKA